MRVFNEMIRVPVMVILVILLFYTLLNPAEGERLRTLLSRLGQAGLSVVDFVPEGKWVYTDMTRIKLPAKEEHFGSVEEFISMAEKHNQDTVHRSRLPAPWGVSVYYIFNQNMNIAWTYYAW